MVAFTYRMPAGIAGDINRAQAATVEAAQITASGASGAPPKFGVGVVVDATSGKIRTPLTTGDTKLYGVLARAFPATSSQDGLGTSTPPASGLVDVMTRGYMTVLLQNSTAAVKGGAVFCRVQNPTGPLPLGGFEAASTGDTITIAGAYFMGPADSSGNVEIGFNI